MAGEQTGLDFCYEKDGLLIFDSSYKMDENIYLFDKTAEELNEICKIIPECDEVYIDTEDLSSVKGLKFKDGAKVYFAGSEPLPDDLDFSNCSEIHLGGRDLSKIPPQTLREGSVFSYIPSTSTGLQISNMPPFSRNIDVSKCSSVTINADLVELSEMNFKDGAKVDLSRCSNLPENLDVSNCSEVSLSECDLSTIKNLRFCDGASVSLAYCQNIPADIDISRCSSIDLSGNDLSKINNIRFAEDASVNLSKCQNIPADLDVSQCKHIGLSGCNLSNVEKLNFKDGACVNLSGSNLPENLDLSNCDEIDLSGCDLSKIKNIKFKEGAKVNLSGCKNIPEDLDVSKCSEVNLSKCDLHHIDNLQLKDGVKINLEDSQLPKNIDFTKCAELNLSDCDLSQVSEVRFRQGSILNLQGCENIPNNLDVSMCKEVWLTPSQFDHINLGNAHVVIGAIACDKIDFSKLKSFSIDNVVQDEILGNSYLSFNGTKEFVFRDEAQYREFLEKGGKVPNGCDVSFSKESVKKTMKRDHENAQDYMRRKQSPARHNSAERAELREIMKRKPITNSPTPQYFSQAKTVEPSSSTRIPKPLILQKIKRQNG